MGQANPPGGSEPALSLETPRPAATETTKTRILLVDDHALVLEGIAALIELEDDLRVVGRANSMVDAVRLARLLKPDLIITDLSMPGVHAAQSIIELRHNSPTSRIIVLTMHDSEDHVRSALSAGASGYLLKDTHRSELIYGIRSVLSGQQHLCARAAARVVRGYLGEPWPGTQVVVGVTGRERMILLMVARGRSSKLIARDLKRSIKTVEKHRSNLMRKLNLHNVADVTRYAMECGLYSSAEAGDEDRV